MLLGAMMRGRLGLGCRAALSASGIGFPQASRVLLAAGLFLGAGTAGATSQTGSPKPKEVPWEDETGCTGEGAVAFALIKRAIFESTGFPHPSENYLKCEDVVSLPFAPFGKNAVVQVRNETFCKEGYCQTFIYNRTSKTLSLAMEATRDFRLHHQEGPIHKNLAPYFNHTGPNLYNVLSFRTRSGYLVVTEGFNDVLMINFFQQQ